MRVVLHRIRSLGRTTHPAPFVPIEGTLHVLELEKPMVVLREEGRWESSPVQAIQRSLKTGPGGEAHVITENTEYRVRFLSEDDQGTLPSATTLRNPPRRRRRRDASPRDSKA